MRKIKLSINEKEIEGALIHGEYIDIDKNGFKNIVQSVAERQKDFIVEDMTKTRYPHLF